MIGYFVLRVALLCGIWLLALGTVSLGDVVIGVVVSAALVLLPAPPATPVEHPPLLRRVLGFVPLLMAVLWEIMLGTWRVALVVLGRRPHVPGTIEVPIGPRTRTGVAMTALLVTLAPGSVLVDVDWERQLMLFRVLDASDPDATRAEIDRLYERFQRAVFP
ncbi:MAG: Na+/H+ antiporter subunit E [Sphaerobacter sp.]|nr:Na+/H+ antiporter subunit E [Sphaerobacter sp.]